MSGTDTTEEHVFHHQQWVLWNSGMVGSRYHPSDRIDEGPPYQVHHVRMVDCRCTCGVGDRDYPHDRRCGVPNRLSVGHSQMVTIIADGEHHVFSGAWLTPISRRDRNE